MPSELVPVVEAVLNVYPEKKTGFERFMEAANLVTNSFGGTIGAISSGLNGILQTCALMHGRHELRKIVEYTSGVEETKMKCAVEMRRLDILQEKQRLDHDIQQSVLKLYVDRQYQNAVDHIVSGFQRTSLGIAEAKHQMIRELDEYSKYYMRSLNANYRRIVCEQELVYAAYKDYLGELERNGIDRIRLASDLSFRCIDCVTNLSNEKLDILLQAVLKLTEPKAVKFEDFTSMRNRMQDGHLGDG